MTSKSNYNPYIKLSNFGHINPVLKTDAVAYSIYDDIDAYFDIGPTAKQFGPSSEKSHLYMAERCAKNWDGACELMSRNEQKALSNVGGINSSTFYIRPPPSDLTIGDVLVDNAGVQRFCDLSSCSFTQESFNPVDPDSPMIKKYGAMDCGKKCNPVCMPPNDPDKDVLLNKVLDRPDKHVDLLVNMYKNVTKNNKREQYKNTRVGMVFDILEMYLKSNPDKL